MSGEGLAKLNPGTGSIAEFTGFRNPEQVLAEAQKAAAALKKIVDAKPKKVVINEKVFLEIEDWLTVGSFFGHSAKVVEDRFVSFGAAQGFEAKAVVLDQDGNEVTSAWAMCLNDEDKWGMRAKYEWQDEKDANGRKIWVAPAGGKKGYYKGKRVKIGEEPTPLFQLRSMAGTRACSKALSLRFRWVVVLAGYQPTPAEEVDQNTIGGEGEGGGEGDQGKKEGFEQPKKKGAGAGQEGSQGAGEKEKRGEAGQAAGLELDATGLPAAAALGVPAPPATPPETDPRSTTAQQGAIGSIFSRLGIKDEGDRHRKGARILGVEEIKSFKEIAKEQASYLIKFLDTWSAKASGK